MLSTAQENSVDRIEILLLDVLLDDLLFFFLYKKVLLIDEVLSVIVIAGVVFL